MERGITGARFFSMPCFYLACVAGSRNKATISRIRHHAGADGKECEQAFEPFGISTRQQNHQKEVPSVKRVLHHQVKISGNSEQTLQSSRRDTQAPDSIVKNCEGNRIGVGKRTSMLPQPWRSLYGRFFKMIGLCMALKRAKRRGRVTGTTSRQMKPSCGDMYVVCHKQIVVSLRHCHYQRRET